MVGESTLSVPFFREEVGYVYMDDGMVIRGNGPGTECDCAGE